MLHETAVSWIRVRLARTVPRKAWEKTRDAFITRLKDVVREVNETCDVDGLCRALPKRIAELVDAEGDRLSH